MSARELLTQQEQIAIRQLSERPAKREFLILEPGVVSLTEPKKGAQVNQDVAACIVAGDWLVVAQADGNPGETGAEKKGRDAAETAVAIALQESGQAIDHGNHPDPEGDLFPTITDRFSQIQRQYGMGDTTLTVVAYNRQRKQVVERSLGTTLAWLYEPQQKSLQTISAPALQTNTKLLLEAQNPDLYHTLLLSLVSATTKADAMKLATVGLASSQDQEAMATMMQQVWEKRKESSLLTPKNLGTLSKHDGEISPGGLILIGTDGVMGTENARRPILLSTLNRLHRGDPPLKKVVSELHALRTNGLLTPDTCRSEDDGTLTGIRT